MNTASVQSDTRQAESVPVQPIERPRPHLKRGGFVRELIETVILIALVYTLVNLLSMRFYIEGESMESNFFAGQFLIVSRAHYLFGQPEYGDIVVFDAPGDDNRANNPLLIKRLIGKPGDHIVVLEGQLFRNGVLINEPYIYGYGDPSEPAFRCRTDYCDIVLGENQYYLMGDHRNDSNDSRAFGPVDHYRIVGEAIFRYWPLPDIGSVVRYAYSE
jgi:signal peptidase I